jgi:hypothetical protein
MTDIKFLHPQAAHYVTEELILDNKAFPLLREITHKYALRVIDIGAETSSHNSRLLLADEQGFVVASIWKDKSNETYNIRSVASQKDRGRHWEDRFTYYGKRISSLMKVVAKECLIPSNTTDAIKVMFDSQLRSCVQNISNDYGTIGKSNSMFSGDDIHKLLQIVLNNRSLESLPKESIANIKDTFDKYEQIDNIRVKRREEMAAMFSKPIAVATYDNLGFMYGKLKLTPVYYSNRDDDAGVSKVDVEIVENFRRLRDIEEVPELIPTLTMHKVYMQEKNVDYKFVGDSGLFPEKAVGYVPELRVASFTDNERWGQTAILKSTWMLIHE